MRYQITQHGWPVGDRLIPNGTVIDDASQDDWSKLIRTKGLSPPINAMPLDQPTWTAMQSLYPDHIKWIITPGGIPR
jgi:hypothetical protein